MTFLVNKKDLPTLVLNKKDILGTWTTTIMNSTKSIFNKDIIQQLSLE